jgi:hypothetical protein
MELFQASSAAAESTATTATSPAASKPAKRVAEGGVVVEDVKQGHGPEAKIGKMVPGSSICHRVLIDYGCLIFLELAETASYLLWSNVRLTCT